MEQTTTNIFRLTEMIETQVKELADSDRNDLHDSFKAVEALLEDANYILSRL